jgi:rod shape-determining protein MreD
VSDPLRNGSLIGASFVVALLLTAIPLPAGVQPFVPEWAALVLIYWCLALPARIGVGAGWLVGLLLDVLKGTLLGQHALGLTVIAFLVVQAHQRLRVHPRWQQSLTVMFLLGVNQLLVLWIYGMMGRPPTEWLHWAPAVTGGLLWPTTFALLRGMRRKYRIS